MPSGAGAESVLDVQDLSFHHAKRAGVSSSDEQVCQARDGDRHGCSSGSAEGIPVLEEVVFGTTQVLPNIVFLFGKDRFQAA